MGNRFYDGIIFDDINYLKHNFVTVHKTKEDKGKSHFIYSFENGKIFRIYIQNNTVQKEEIMYVHFQKRHLDIKTEIADSFTIIPNRIVKYNANVNKTFLKENVKRHLFYSQYFRIKYTSLRRKVKALFY